MRPPLTPTPDPPRRNWIPWFALLVVVLFTIVGASYVRYSAAASDRMRFANDVSGTKEDIQDRLEMYVDTLRGTVGLYSARGEVTHAEFRAYQQQLNLQQRYPGSRGIGFAERVLPGQQQNLIARVRATGAADFLIEPFAYRDWAALSAFQIRPAGERPEYFPIIELEPLDRRNSAALGYDMFSQPDRAEAMSRARDTGQAAATRKVTLIQEIDATKQPGFLIYVPVYALKMPHTTVAQRRLALKGFVYSPFRADDLLRGVLTAGRERSVDFQLYDGTNQTPGQLLYDSSLDRPPVDRSFSRHTRTEQIKIAGMIWTLVFNTRPEFQNRSSNWLIPYIFIIGAVFAIALFLVTGAQGRARFAAERAATELLRSQEALRQSEERYRSLVLATAQIVWTTDAGGNVVEDLPSWRAFTGQTVDELKNNGWMSVVHPEDRPRVSEVWAQSLANASGHKQEFRVRAADGTWRHILARCVPVLERDGRLKEWVGTCSDITLRKRAEDALRFLSDASAVLAASLNYEQTLKNLAQSAVPGIADWCSVDLLADNGSLLRISIAHVEPNKMQLARELAKRYPTDINARTGPPQVIRTGRAEYYPNIPDTMLETIARDGQHLKLLRDLGLKSAIIVPLSARGRTFGAITLVSAESGHRYTDDDLVLAEELARRASVAVDNARLYGEAQDANRIKDEFLAIVSHELRTPLNAILGWSQLLQQGSLDNETIAEAVDAVQRNAKAQAQLIEDLLDISRIIRGQIEMEKRPVELATVLKDALDVVAPSAVQKRIDIRQQISPDTILVEGDPTRLQQVIWNLLSNAVKFTPEDGHVDLQLERQYGEAVIAVADTGQGISPAFLPYVFDRFRQADSSTTRRHGGLGLGLAIVRHLVELHGGSVRAQSAGEGKGARFVVRLPIVAPAATKAVPDPATQAPQAERISLAGVKVLVVDDDPDAQMLLQAILEGYGASVVAVGSAQAVMDAMDQALPDVLISDIGMPGEDGYTLLRRVRARGAENGGQTPAAAVTAFAHADDRIRALAAGFQFHLSKPIEAAELVRTVAVLSGRRARSATPYE